MVSSSTSVDIGIPLINNSSPLIIQSRPGGIFTGLAETAPSLNLKVIGSIASPSHIVWLFDPCVLTSLCPFCTLKLPVISIDSHPFD